MTNKPIKSFKITGNDYAKGGDYVLRCKNNDLNQIIVHQVGNDVASVERESVSGRSIILTPVYADECDCHNHEHQVCNTCQGVDDKPQDSLTDVVERALIILREEYHKELKRPDMVPGIFLDGIVPDLKAALERHKEEQAAVDALVFHAREAWVSMSPNDPKRAELDTALNYLYSLRSKPVVEEKTNELVDMVLISPRLESAKELFDAVMEWRDLNINKSMGTRVFAALAAYDKAQEKKEG